LAVFKGKAAYLAIVAAKVGEIDKVQWQSKRDLAEITSFGNPTADKTFDSQLAEFTIVADGRFDEADAQQVALMTGHQAGTDVVSVRMYVSATHYFQGTVQVEAFDVAIAPNAPATVHIACKGQGVWTYT
jgi:hypothetical protein